MKTFIVFFILVFYTALASSEEIPITQFDVLTSGQEVYPKQPAVQWVDYLSESEKDQITLKLVEQELQRLKTTGELDSLIGLDDEEILKQSVFISGAVQKLNTASSNAFGDYQAATGGGETSDVI